MRYGTSRLHDGGAKSRSGRGLPQKPVGSGCGFDVGLVGCAAGLGGFPSFPRFNPSLDSATTDSNFDSWWAGFLSSGLWLILSSPCGSLVSGSRSKEWRRGSKFASTGRRRDEAEVGLSRSRRERNAVNTVTNGGLPRGGSTKGAYGVWAPEEKAAGEKGAGTTHAHALQNLGSVGSEAGFKRPGRRAKEGLWGESARRTDQKGMEGGRGCK